MTRGSSEPHPVDTVVGRRIREKRIELGCNQTDLGRGVGLTFQQIQKYEKGSNRVSASKLWAIANFLDVKISYFFADLDTSGVLGSEGGDAGLQPSGGSEAVLEIRCLIRSLGRPRQRLILELMKSLRDLDVQNEPCRASGSTVAVSEPAEEFG